MNILLVVSDVKDWPIDVPDVTLVPARTYLTDPKYFDYRSAKVLNLSRSYRYQSAGYYVSLLAAARGHKPLPDPTTIQDLRTPIVARVLSEDVEKVTERAFKGRTEDQVVDVYFGRSPDPGLDTLARNLFSVFEAPLMRAEFSQRAGEWQLRRIRALGASEVAPAQHDFLIKATTNYFTGRRPRVRRRNQSRYDLAILQDPQELEPPSNKRAIERFESAAEDSGFSVELITKEDTGRLAEFDALFIRETTAVNHHTFRMARRAEAEGLVVIDDSNSILKCTNKVYLAELLNRQRVACPKTLVVHGDNIDEVAAKLGTPVVLKQPDSAFSKGVSKVEDPAAVKDAIRTLLTTSELIVAQEFLPTAFDWRVGIIDRQPLYVCKYFMARRHWQIIRRNEAGASIEGNAETLAVDAAPPAVVETALKAANLIGDGFYGVDLKQVGEKVYVIEVNDNPSVDSPYEDAVLKLDLYQRVMNVFISRIEARKRGPRT